MTLVKILLAIFYLIRRQNVFSQPYCCPNNVSLYLNLSLYICENAEPPSISCDKIPFTIPDTLYTIQNDTEGEYLDIIYKGIIVRSPYFCIGQHTLEGSAAVYCPTHVQNSTETPAEYEEFLSNDEILKYFSMAIGILNFISALFMALMTAAWFTLPDGEMEEQILFHLSLSLSSAHAFYLYNLVSSNGILPKFCLIILYSTFFFVLSTFTWFFLIIYYLWKKYKFDTIPSIVAQHYRIVGYGIPTLLVVSGTIHTYVREIVNSSDFKLGCSTFYMVLEEFYIHPFVIITALSNKVLWCNLRRHMRNTISITPENELLQLKINELLRLTGRLLLVLALPWLLLSLCDSINELTLFRFEFLFYVSSSLDIATSGAGILVCVVMVTSHPRLKIWVFQKIRCLIRMQSYRKNVSERQEFSLSRVSDDLQMEPSAEERVC